VPGTLEHTISQLVDQHVDLSVYAGRYNNDASGATAIHPKILLKVILVAYSKGMISSRQTPALAFHLKIGFFDSLVRRRKKVLGEVTGGQCRIAPTVNCKD